MNKKSRKLLTWCLVLCMVLTQMLFTNVAFAANRYSGTNRYLTALEIVKNGWTKSDAAVIARGDELADALAAAPLAYAKGNAPILLTETNALPAGVMDELVALGVKNVYIVGGTGAVSADVEKALQDKFGAANVARIAGANRVETAYKVAKEAFATDPTAVVLANAYAYADALSVSSVAAAKGMPVLLVDGTMTPEVAAYVAGKTVYAVGGTAVLPDASLPAGAKRLSGANRYATNAAILTEFAADLDYTKVYVAKGEDDNLADALAGSALAALTKSPIVLADASNTVAAATNVLKANLKENSTVVGLGGSAALADAALAAVEGLRPVTTELKVESVTSLNLKQINVLFSGVVNKDDAEDVDNYVVEDADGNTLDIANAELNGNNVILTLKDNYDASGKFVVTNQETLTVTVKEALLDSNEDYSADVEMIDTTLPTVKSLAVVGISTLKVVFSEPINPNSDVKSAFEVTGDDGQKLYVKDVTLTNNDTEANIELYSDVDTLNSVTVKVSGDAEDFAGFGVIGKTLTANVVKDEEAPYVVSAKDVSNTSVTLVFNEDVKLLTDKTDFYHTNTKNPATNVTVDGKEVTIEFDSTTPIPYGTAYIHINASALEDLWENEIDDITYAVTNVEDVTKPTVDKVEQGSTEKDIVVTFSEDVEKTSATTKSNYLLKDSDGNTISIKSIAYDDVDKDNVTITATETLSGTCTLQIINVEDLAGNKLDKVIKTIVMKDKTAPVLEANADCTVTYYKAGTKDQVLVIRYPEAMLTGDTLYGIDNLSKYTLVGTGFNEDVEDLYGAKLTVLSSGKSVEIALPYDSDEDNSYDLSKIASLKLEIGKVKDASGNKVALAVSTIDVNPPSNIAIDTVKAIDTNKVEVTFNDKVAYDAKDLAFYADTDGTSGYSAGDTKLVVSNLKVTTNSDGNTVVTFTLADDLGYDAKTVAGKDVYVVAVDNLSDNKYGETLEKGVATIVDDAIIPELDTYVAEDPEVVDNPDLEDVAKVVYDATNHTITLTFKENMKNEPISPLAFSLSEGKVTAVTVNGKDVVLTVNEDGDTIDTNTVVTQKFAIRDANDNEVTGISENVALVK